MARVKIAELKLPIAANSAVYRFKVHYEPDN